MTDQTAREALRQTVAATLWEHAAPVNGTSLLPAADDVIAAVRAYDVAAAALACVDAQPSPEQQIRDDERSRCAAELRAFAERMTQSVAATPSQQRTMRWAADLLTQPEEQE